MQIIKTPNGWLVEPSTKEELDHIIFLFDALSKTYGQLASTEDSEQANHSHLPLMDRNEL